MLIETSSAFDTNETSELKIKKIIEMVKASDTYDSFETIAKDNFIFGQQV
ncbi:hypothetical protein [Mucilaginibacter gilvus]|nr:hypothetical protein [Mucilaginibacter gilvus]